MRRFMIVAALVAGSAVPASAAREFDTRSLTCDRANAIVSDRGAVVMNIGPSAFDRFVSSIRYCDRGELIRVRAVRAADTSSCDLKVCFRPKRGNQ